MRLDFGPASVPIGAVPRPRSHGLRGRRGGAFSGTLAASGAAGSKGHKSQSQDPTWDPLHATRHCHHPPIQRRPRVVGDTKTSETRRAGRFRRRATHSQAPLPNPWEIAPPLEVPPKNKPRQRLRANGPGQSLPWTSSTRPRKKSSKRAAGLEVPNSNLTNTLSDKGSVPNFSFPQYVHSHVMSTAGFPEMLCMMR